VLVLALYTLVAVGRIQDAWPPLAAAHIGFIFGCMALIAWVAARPSWAEKIPVQITPVKCVLALFGIGFVTIPVAVWPGGSLAFLTASFLKTVLLFLFIITLCRTIRDVRWIIWACLAGGVTLVLHGILTAAIYDRYHYGDETTFDTNDLCLFLVMLIPLAFLLIKTSAALGKALVLGALGIILYGIVLTQSRGGFLALLVVGALIVRRSTFTRQQKLAIGVLAVFVFGKDAKDKDRKSVV